MSNAGSYRGISLSSIVTKLYNIMILNRRRPVIETHLRVNQNGFPQSKTTVAQVLSLRRIIEGARKKNLPAVLTHLSTLRRHSSQFIEERRSNSICVWHFGV